MIYATRGARAAIVVAVILAGVLIPATSSAACPDFATAVPYDVGTTPISIVSADFNRDGKLDLAVANSASDNVSILLGNGDGTFATAVDYGAGSSPSSVASADFNGDGKADLAVANRGSGDVSILLGSGSGTFGTAVGYGAGTEPLSIAVGDFDRDGKSDLAVASIGSNDVSILLGSGTGTFASAVPYGAGDGVASVAVGDFNSDGKADLAVANRGSGDISILPGIGDGTFDAKLNTGTINGLAGVAIGDFNGDGKSDLAAPTGSAGRGDVAILLGNGDYTFGLEAYYTAESNTSFVAVADVNGDGISDLAVTNDTGNVTILQGDGSGKFESAINSGAGSTPSSIAVGDFNGDGKPDLAVGDDSSTNILVLLNTGICSTNCGGFASPATIATGTSPASVVVGDFNHDGRLDAAISNSGSANVSIRLGDGNGGFVPGGDFPAETLPLSIAIGDFNRDGNADLAVTNFTTQSYSILLGDGLGAFTTANYQLTPQFSGQFSYVAVGDINGDGKEDLVISNASSIALYALLGVGDGTFGPPSVPIIATFLKSFGVVIADFNRDGKLDVAAADNNSTNVAVSLGNGTGTFAPKVNYFSGTFPYQVATGDFNGDGNPDLVVANSGSDDVAVLMGIGDGTFAPAVSYAAGRQPLGVRVADFDVDGKVDLVVNNQVSNNVSILRGNGDGTFAFAVPYGVGNSPYSVATGDFNRDGRPDLVVANNASNNASILLNACPVSIDLTIKKTHTGILRQSDTGKTYKIVVSNIGGPPTSGLVTVTDALPIGLTATSLNGTGWVCLLGPPLTCTRSDGLAGAASYPAITLTVNVDSDAPASVTNVVGVSGGGDANGANNSSSDPASVFLALPPAPVNVVATGTSATTASVTWDVVATADAYQVRRRSAPGPYTVAGFVTTNSLNDSFLTPNTAYLYWIVAFNGGGFSPDSNTDLATTVEFTDDPLVAGTTTAKWVHLSELRTAVNAARITAGLTLATFTDAVAPGLMIKPVHVTQLRSNLDAALSALGFPAISYVDPALAADMKIKGAHFQQIRTGVK